MDGTAQMSRHYAQRWALLKKSFLQAHPSGTTPRKYPGTPKPMLFTRDFEPGYDGATSGMNLFREQEVYGDSKGDFHDFPMGDAEGEPMGPPEAMDEGVPPGRPGINPRAKPPRDRKKEHEQARQEERVEKRRNFVLERGRNAHTANLERRRAQPPAPPVPEQQVRPLKRNIHSANEAALNTYQGERRYKKKIAA